MIKHQHFNLFVGLAGFFLLAALLIDLLTTLDVSNQSILSSLSKVKTDLTSLKSVLSPQNQNPEQNTMDSTLRESGFITFCKNVYQFTVVDHPYLTLTLCACVGVGIFFFLKGP